MKAVANNCFIDLKEDVTREPGDVFTCTKERFNELVENLPEGFVSEAPRDKKE